MNVKITIGWQDFLIDEDSVASIFTIMSKSKVKDGDEWKMPQLRIEPEPDVEVELKKYKDWWLEERKKNEELRKQLVGN